MRTLHAQPVALAGDLDHAESLWAQRTWRDEAACRGLDVDLVLRRPPDLEREARADFVFGIMLRYVDELDATRCRSTPPASS